MKGGKFKDFFKVPLRELLEQFNDDVKEDKALKRFISSFIDDLRKKGFNSITEDMSFFQILKDKGRLSKQEMVELIETIFEKIGKAELFRRRPISRLNIYFKDLLLVYAVSENSQVIEDIANNYFADFEFNKKFGDNVLTITKKWNESVENIRSHMALSHLFSDDEAIDEIGNLFIDNFDIYPDFY